MADEVKLDERGLEKAIEAARGSIVQGEMYRRMVEPIVRAYLTHTLGQEWRPIDTANGDPLIPANSWDAFAYLISRCASGLYGELVKGGCTDAQARNSIIHAFLDMAAGEACRVARREGRSPEPEKWREAVTNAFDRAVKRTTQSEGAAPPPSMEKKP